MKKKQKIICLALAVLLFPALLTGCGKAPHNEFHVLFAAPFVNEELIESYNAKLPKEGELPFRCSGFSFGSEDVDPVVYASGAMAMTAMLSAGEVDVLVCDLDNAARYARSGAFYDLRDIFTPEELAEYEDSLISFPLIDNTGELTEETTGPCGLDLAGRSSLTTILGDEHYGAFIVFSACDLDLTRDTIRELWNAE